MQKLVTENKQRFDEVKDMEKRENNIIIYRIKEDNIPSADQRKKDKEFVLKLFTDILDLDIAESDIKALFRLGKKGTEENQNNESKEKSRPLLVQFKEKKTKNFVMESVIKLKEAEAIFKNLSIAHDFTKAEREVCKRLVSEAKANQLKDTTGEFKWLVKGPPSNLRLIRVKKN